MKAREYGGAPESATELGVVLSLGAAVGRGGPGQPGTGQTPVGMVASVGYNIVTSYHMCLL